MFGFILSIISFSIPCPFYYQHTIKVIPQNVFDKYKDAFNNYMKEEMKLEKSFLDGPIKEYLLNIQKVDEKTADTLHEEYTDSVNHQMTYSFAHNAKTLNDCLSNVKSNVYELTIELYIDVTDQVDFGKLSNKVRVELEAVTDKDPEEEITEFNEMRENDEGLNARVDAIKSGKLPKSQQKSKTLHSTRPRIHTKSDKNIDFKIKGGDFSSKISRFKCESNIKLNIEKSDFIVGQIKSDNFNLNGQYKLRSKGVIVSLSQDNIGNIISEYQPTTIYFSLDSPDSNKATIDFNQNQWAVSINGKNEAVLQKQDSVKEFGLYFTIEKVNDIDLNLPKVCEIPGNVILEMTHDDYIYMIYYYFQSKGIQYDESYNHIPELPDMINQLFEYKFPDEGSKLLSSTIKSKYFKKANLKANLLDDQEIKTQIKLGSSGSWDQIKSLPEITLVKPSQVTVDKSNLQSNVKWDDHIHEESNDPPQSSKKKGGSSSNSSSSKDDDDERSAKRSSYTLPNFRINEIYVGASTILNFSLGFKMMSKARRTFGKIIPPPNFLHTAIWVGPSNSNNQTLGAILVYGKYSSKFDDRTYLSKDGARSFVMSLREFIEYFDYCNVMKLESQRNIKLFDFIDEVKKSGKWNIEKYNWPSNNCQHFTANCINILKSTRKVTDQNDWANFPPSVYKALKTNEMQKLTSVQENQHE